MLSRGVGPQMPSESSVWASGQCTHPRLWRAGFIRGRQRYVCPLCRAYKVPGVTGVTRLCKPRLQQAIELAPMFAKGMPVCEASRRIGWCTTTVRLAYKLLRRVHMPLCPCGRESTHSGFCTARQYRRGQRQIQWVEEKK